MFVWPYDIVPDTMHTYQCHHPLESDKLFALNPLLLTSKTVHDEAANALSGENRFVFDDIRSCCENEKQEPVDVTTFHFCGITQMYFLQLIGARIACDSNLMLLSLPTASISSTPRKVPNRPKARRTNPRKCLTVSI